MPSCPLWHHCNVVDNEFNLASILFTVHSGERPMDSGVDTGIHMCMTYEHHGTSNYVNPQVVADRGALRIWRYHSRKEGRNFDCSDSWRILPDSCMVPTRSLFPGKVLSLKHGCPGPGKVLTFEYLRLKSGKSPCFQSLCQNSNDKHHLAHMLLNKWWQWRKTFRESQRPVNQSPVPCGMTAAGSRQNTMCFIHKILLRSSWEPIGARMMSRGNCMQFDWSTVSLVYMVHALQTIKHSLGNTAT